MKYIIFVILWVISQADSQTLTAEVNAAHQNIDRTMNAIRLAIRRLDKSFVETVWEESKTSLIADVEAFIDTLPEPYYLSVSSFMAQLRGQLLRAVETMFTVDYGERDIQNSRRQFQQALKAYINVPFSTFNICNANASSEARLIMKNLAERAIDKALSALENVSTRFIPTA